MSDPTASGHQDPEATPGRRGIYWLLLIPYLGTLIVPFYDHAGPTLIGMPFFYWYLFLWVILSALLTGLVYLVTRPAGSKGAVK